jgi:hypothetical protein
MEDNESNFNEIYEYNVSAYLGNGYLPLLEDLIRMWILQFVVQFMFFVRNPLHYSLFDVEYIETLLYIALGVCAYWLVFKKLVRLK